MHKREKAERLSAELHKTMNENVGPQTTDDPGRLSRNTTGFVSWFYNPRRGYTHFLANR